jgi:hypothetical protein
MFLVIGSSPPEKESGYFLVPQRKKESLLLREPKITKTAVNMKRVGVMAHADLTLWGVGYAIQAA